MIPTITRGLRQRNIDTGELTYWANKELNPLLAQLIQAANYVSRVQATWTTNASAIDETMWSSQDIAKSTAVRFDVSVTAWASNDRAIFTRTALFFNDGTVQQEDVTLIGPTINNPGWNVKLVIASNHIEIKVNDAGSNTVDWVATIDATVAP